MGVQETKTIGGDSMAAKRKIEPAKIAPSDYGINMPESLAEPFLLSRLMGYEYVKAVFEQGKTLYHGTAADPAKLQKDGIVPRGSNGAEAWANSKQPGVPFAHKGDPYVFASPFEALAAYYAKMAAQVNNGVPHVVKIRVPADRVKEWEADIGNDSLAMRHRGVVPGAWITDTGEVK